MYTFKRTGQMGDVIREVRDLPARLVPYATAAALSRTIKTAKDEIVGEMRQAFDQPVAYTLNALRVETATKDKLAARVAVKNQAGGRGVRQESYLLPGVEGGDRSEKRFERAFRYGGLLRPGERAMPGEAIERDAAGNVPGGIIRTILRQVGALQRKGKTVEPRRRAKGAAGARPVIFYGEAGRRRTRGIWQREGRRVGALFVFTRRLPKYRPRLDFAGTAERVAREVFPTEFRRAMDNLLMRRR